MKAITLMVIGGAVLLTGRYLYDVNNSQYQIVIVVTGRADKITLQGVQIRVSYNIKNPTGASLRMSPPLIRITLNGKQVATSSMQQVDIPESARDASGNIKIKANAETGEIETILTIPWLALLSTAPDLVARFKDLNRKNKIALKVETKCQVFTLVGAFPYEQVSTIKV